MISEFPLFVFTTLGGLAAGAYATSAAFPAGRDAKRAWLLPLACLALLAAGLVGLPLHLGRPERLLIALTQPGAMIAQEAYWSMALGIIMLVDLVVTKRKGAAPRALRIVGAVVALGLMAVMANAYFVSVAVPAWASWQTFAFYVFGDLAMGAALLALIDRELLGRGSYAIAAPTLSVLAAVACALEAAHFASADADAVLLIVGAVLAVAGTAAAVAAKSGKMPAKTVAPVAFACLFVAVAVARYGFYAACVL